MDEPTSALDVESAEHVRHTNQELIERGRRYRGEEEPMGILMVTHSKEMMKEADRIVMEQGE